MSRYAQAKLKNDSMVLKFCMSPKKWPNFEKKFFFANFHEFSKYRKIFKCDLKKMHPHKFHSNIAHSKEEIILFQKMKKFGGGSRGWNRVKFHFESIRHFSNLENRGISRRSSKIMIFFLIMVETKSIFYLF